MKLSDYSEQAILSDKTPKSFKGKEKLHFLVHGLTSSAGEIAGILKKNEQQGGHINSRKDHLKRRLGGLLWYLNAVGSEQGIGLEEIARENLEYVSRRWHQDNLPGLVPV